MTFIARDSTAGVDSTWLTFNSATRTASGTSPTITGVRQRYTYRFTATNASGSDTETITITVADSSFLVTWNSVAYNAATNKISANIRFSHAVTNINSSDFSVINSGNIIQTGWTFDTPLATANANTCLLYTSPSPRD